MNFIEKNTKKVALVLSLATCACAVTSVYAASNSDGWHNGVFKEDGKVKTAWLFQEEGTYYLDKEGRPLTGWQTIDGSTYYFNAEGLKVSGKVIIDGHEYTFQKSGKLLTGWQDDNTKYYSAYGIPLTGVQKIGDNTYNFDENGTIKQGWSKLDGKKVYFTKDGKLATGEVKIDGKKYNFAKDGTFQSGWVKKDGKKLYYSQTGYLTKGWKDIDGKTYYFDKKSGEMVTGWKTINDKKYYFEDNGAAVKDKEDYKGYDFDEDGVATKHVDEVTYYANTSNGYVSKDVNWNPTGSGGNSDAASLALAYVGYPYVWGGTSPSGFDCSGLVQYVYNSVGISMPRTAGAQGSVGSAVSYNNMQYGDLIIWDSGAHISIYIGNGQMVHAANPRTGVTTNSVSDWASWGQSITSIRRP